MTAADIRAKAIERIARVLFDADAADACSGDPFEDWAARYRRKAEPFIDALAAAGLLPTQARDSIEARIRAVVLVNGEHRYLSTYCVDGDHSNCRRTCMQCEAPCVCSCGHPEATEGDR
jgi:hypothetical protein